MKNTNILRLLRMGSQEYRVHLACGHSYSVPVAELDRQQLYIGKRVVCRECGKGDAPKAAA